MTETYRVFVGIDWASQSHQICVIDSERTVLKELSAEHSGDGLAALGTTLLELAKNVPEQIAVAIEVPRGPVVEALVDRGIHVYAINPKQLDRFRDRHNASGAKDDRRDAFVLADSLRTDRPAFRRARLDDPVLIQLRELTRTEEELKRDLARASDQLRELLVRYFPQLLKLCPAADESWLWELLQLAPTPKRASTVKAPSLKRILKNARIRRFAVEELRGLLKTTPLKVAPGVVEAAEAHVGLLLPRLQLLDGLVKRCGRQIEALLGELQAPQASEDAPGQKHEHRDVDILLSMPGLGRVIAATMLAEASQPLAERDYHALRSQAGVAPVTKQSGKKRQVVMRYSCNNRLREAVHHLARCSTQSDALSQKYYREHRARGHTHGHALRAVGDRLLHVLVAMLRKRELYDAGQRRATA